MIGDVEVIEPTKTYLLVKTLLEYTGFSSFKLLEDYIKTKQYKSEIFF